jgi:hypothetical protein
VSNKNVIYNIIYTIFPTLIPLEEDIIKFLIKKKKKKERKKEERTRLCNSGSRSGLMSTRPTRLHKRVQHEPDPIINWVKIREPNTTRL